MACNSQKLSFEALEQLRKKGRQQNAKLIYVFLEEAIGFAISENDFLLADDKVIFQQKLTGGQNNPSNIEKYESPSVSEALYKMALESGHTSRFKTDPHFENGEFEKLYQLWIGNSVNGKIADAIWCHFEKQQACSLLTMGRKEGFAEIGLLAVAEKLRGAGLGKQLIDKAKWQTVQWDLKELKVATQRRNEGACRFYEQNGFVLEQVVYTYHLWI